MSNPNPLEVIDAIMKGGVLTILTILLLVGLGVLTSNVGGILLVATGLFVIWQLMRIAGGFR